MDVTSQSQKTLFNWQTLGAPLWNYNLGQNHTGYALYINDLWIEFLPAGEGTCEGRFFISKDGYYWAQACSLYGCAWGPITYGDGQIVMSEDEAFGYSSYNVSECHYGTNEVLYYDYDGRFSYFSIGSQNFYFYVTIYESFVSNNAMNWTLIDTTQNVTNIELIDMWNYSGFVGLNEIGGTVVSKDGINWVNGFIINPYTIFTDIACSPTVCLAISRIDKSIFSIKSQEIFFS